MKFFNQPCIIKSHSYVVNVKSLFLGWLYRKKFRTVKNASLTIQRWARGYLARRKVFHIRRQAAAITMQRYIRGWIKRTQYLQAKDRTLRLQVNTGCFIKNGPP